MLIHYSCSQKNLQIFEHIASRTTNFEYTDVSGETQLHWAVMRGTYHILDSLLKIIKEKNLNIDHKSNVITYLI